MSTNKKMNLNKTSGGLGLSECWDYQHGYRHCRCGVCAYCGYSKHSAVHLTLLGAEPGTKPFDHEFIPKEDHK